MPPESVAVGLKVGVMNGTPLAGLSVIGAGQSMTGGIVSETIILNVQEAALLEVSVAVHLTVLGPLVKVDPDAGEQTMDCTPAASIAVASV